MRKFIIAGNWKMNLNHKEAWTLARDIVDWVGGLTDVEVVLCPPFTSLSTVQSVIEHTMVRLGAQNMYWEKEGAFTGEISSNMLLTLGCSYVILGHSERRTYFHETDEIVALKVRAAIDAGLIPIVCVGETRSERTEGVTEKVIEKQITRAFKGLSSERFKGTVIAYEPVWAIGTGLTATAQQAQKVHSYIRELLSVIFNNEIAQETCIQYGGSVKPSNAAELFYEPDIDGGLIGGASLNADSFVEIVKASLL